MINIFLTKNNKLLNILNFKCTITCSTFLYEVLTFAKCQLVPIFLSLKILNLLCAQRSNEMVSTEDTEISLHIRSPRFWASQWGGGGWEYSGVTTENTQSAKICLNFNFWGGGGGGGLWSGIPERGSLENLDTNFSV